MNRSDFAFALGRCDEIFINTKIGKEIISTVLIQKEDIVQLVEACAGMSHEDDVVDAYATNHGNTLWIGPQR